MNFVAIASCTSKTNISCNCQPACALCNFLCTYNVNTLKHTQLRNFVCKYTISCAILHKLPRNYYTQFLLLIHCNPSWCLFDFIVIVFYLYSSLLLSHFQSPPKLDPKQSPTSSRIILRTDKCCYLINYVR